ncbi:MAG: acyl-CoA dehydrogenase family protein [Mycobacterium sp.]
MSSSLHIGSADAEWTMIEEAVFRVFAELADKSTGEHVAIGPRLVELGWSDIEAEYPLHACELLFRAQGRSLANTDCLQRVMLAELTSVVGNDVDGVVLPRPADAGVPGSDRFGVAGIVIGPTIGRLVVPVAGPMGTISIGVVEADQLIQEPLDTFDASASWTRVTGSMTGDLLDASSQWHQAMAAAHRALATELIALADEALHIAVQHVSVRAQFGSPIGSFQSPRHALANAKASLDGARALLGETWRFGGRLSAQAVKIAAGSAHRAVSDTALQVCGAIGLTAEHELHRYVSRGFQIDALCGSYQQLQTRLAQVLFDDCSTPDALPLIVSWTD